MGGQATQGADGYPSLLYHCLPRPRWLAAQGQPAPPCSRIRRRHRQVQLQALYVHFSLLRLPHCSLPPPLPPSPERSLRPQPSPPRHCETHFRARSQCLSLLSPRLFHPGLWAAGEVVYGIDLPPPTTLWCISPCAKGFWSSGCF